MTIETIIGDLKAVAQLVPDTLQYLDELSLDQTADHSLCEKAYWVADYPQYGRKGGEPMLYLARLPHNLMIRHLFDKENSSWQQLLNEKTGYFFHPIQDEAQAVVEAADTLPVPLRALRLYGTGHQYSSLHTSYQYRYLQVRTEDGFVNTSPDPRNPRYEQPMVEEQQLLERVGYTLPFLKTMRNSRQKISVTNLCVLTPDFAFRVTADGPIGRAAWRYSFINCVDSLAVDNLVGSHFGLRGVRLVVTPQGHTLKNGVVPVAPSTAQEITLDTCYQRFLT